MNTIDRNKIVSNCGRCMFCNGLINTSNDIIGVQSNDIQYSLNGSVKLSNGVIIINEKDIKDYLNGTLVFYKKDEDYISLV